MLKSGNAWSLNSHTKYKKNNNFASVYVCLPCFFIGVLCVSCDVCCCVKRCVIWKHKKRARNHFKRWEAKVNSTVREKIAREQCQLKTSPAKFVYKLISIVIKLKWVPKAAQFWAPKTGLFEVFVPFKAFRPLRLPLCPPPSILWLRSLQRLRSPFAKGNKIQLHVAGLVFAPATVSPPVLRPTRTAYCAADAVKRRRFKKRTLYFLVVLLKMLFFLSLPVPLFLQHNLLTFLTMKQFIF